MSPATTPEGSKSKSSSGRLAVALDLGARSWNVAMSAEMGQAPRRRVVKARDLAGLAREIEEAKRRFGLPSDAEVVSCYEAGRDGFWLHRALEGMGVRNRVVDSASIEVNRKARRAKSDGLDTDALLRQLWRHLLGEKKALRVVEVPTAEEEDRRQQSRELSTAIKGRTAVSNRIRAYLVTVGVEVKEVGKVKAKLSEMRQWDGLPLPEGMKARLGRECEEWERLSARIRVVKVEQEKALKAARDRAAEVAARLLELRAIGPRPAWTYAVELFSWRKFRNTKEVSAATGLSPTPYRSGGDVREQGIGKAGNRWVRELAIETAWSWLRYQPQSELSRWYHRRWAQGGSRVRKIGIVALARKLMVALWKYLQTGTLPEGAVRKAGKVMHERTAAA